MNVEKELPPCLFIISYFVLLQKCKHLSIQKNVGLFVAATLPSFAIHVRTKERWEVYSPHLGLWLSTRARASAKSSTNRGMSPSTPYDNK